MLGTFFISYTYVAPGFMLILNSIQEKQLKTYFLIGSIVYDDIINFEVCGFMKNAKSKYLEIEVPFFLQINFFHQTLKVISYYQDKSIGSQQFSIFIV